MRPNNTLEMTRSGDLGGHKTAMKFDENSIAHIMSVLTDLYSDPELAIIREYSTNAIDAHVEAGNKAPIEVTTPSSLSPFFKVKDYGIGLDLDDIENIYSKYGASTKRESDTQTGMLGLGCKSALTYTNQFTLVVIKNGVKSNVMVSRVEDGTGVMETLSSVSTGEPNGVEVIIPVRFSTSFEKKVKEFFSYWTPGTVLLNGREPEFLYGQGKAVGKHLYMTPRPNDEKDAIVMGNVAYPIATKLSGNLGGYYNKFRTVAFVQMGEVNFTPSREALHYTSKTEKTVSAAKTEFFNSYRAAIQKDINLAISRADAIKVYFEYLEMVPGMGGGYTYDSLPISHTYDCKDSILFSPWVTRGNTNMPNRIDYKTVMAALVVTGFDFEKITTTQKSKVKMWIEESGKSFSKVLLCKEIPGLPWTENVVSVSYEDIKALRLNRAAPGTRVKRTAKYDVLLSSGYSEETDDIDDSQNIYYFSPVNFKGCGRHLKNIFPDDILVSIGKNRHAKFIRDFPNAKPILPQIKKQIVDTKASLTKSDVTHLGFSEWEKRNYLGLDVKRINDPEIKTYLLAIAGSGLSPAVDKWRNIISAVGMIEWTASIHNESFHFESKPSPFLTYSLLGRVSDAPKEHMYAYLNAWYAIKTNKENDK